MTQVRQWTTIGLPAPSKLSIAQGELWPGLMLSLPNNPLDRTERFERVRRYLRAFGISHYRAIVFGSVARGDFTAESDTDLLVVSDELPPDLRERGLCFWTGTGQTPPSAFSSRSMADWRLFMLVAKDSRM